MMLSINMKNICIFCIWCADAKSSTRQYLAAAHARPVTWSSLLPALRYADIHTMTGQYVKTEIIILAAGQGTRMRSSLPKVMHSIAGRPMLDYVVKTAEELVDSAAHIHIDTGAGARHVRAGITTTAHWVEQAQQLGIGHAVLQALPSCQGADVIVVLYGDVPMIGTDTLRTLVSACAGNSLALLTVASASPQGYGRIVRTAAGAITKIVEERDASDEIRAINEVNTGIMALPGRYAGPWFEQLNNNNAQGEYYLTDVVGMAAAQGVDVVACHPEGGEMEVMGVNNRLQQAQLERIVQQRQVAMLMEQGVTVRDPARLDIRGTVVAGRDVVIDVNCLLEGHVVLADGVHIGPYCHIADSEIGCDTKVKSHSVVEHSVIGERCDVGPFARLRPGTRLAPAAKIGNFVEIKQATVGTGSKINHLSYIGDAGIGAGVNVGAGTITCNYDGQRKSVTTVEDGAFIGSNTALVAPVSVGSEAVVGAGSTITRNVPAKSLGIARSKQQTVADWKSRKKE